MRIKDKAPLSMRDSEAGKENSLVFTTNALG